MKRIVIWLGQILVFWWLDRMLILIMAALFFGFTRIFCRITVEGQQRVPRRGRVMFLANHPSYIGIFAVIYAVLWPWILWPGGLRMVPAALAKDKYKPLWWILTWRFNIIGVPPKQDKAGRSRVVARVIDYLGQPNCSVWNFPSGTRDEAPGQSQPFNPGVGRMVAQTKPKVVFVGEIGSAEVWSKGQSLPNWQWRFWYGIPLPRRRSVRIYISNPIDPANCQTRLYQICQSQPLDQVGQPVAEYLQLLFEVWLASQQSEEAVLNISGYEQAIPDLLQL